MNVLLINSQTPAMIQNKEYYLPHSVLYLAAALLKNGIEVGILDLNTHKPEKQSNPIEFCKNIIVNRIESQRPTLIGIGCLFSGQFSSTLAYAKVIKEQFGNIPIVIGGIHPTNFPEEILSNCPDLDYIVCGEGETALVELVDALNQNDLTALAQIDGFAYRDNGNVVAHPKTHYITNLDELPFPAYELVDLKNYYHDTSKWHNPRNLPINASIPILSSRSCPYRCSFCSMYTVMGPKWRGRTPANIVDEIEFLYTRYNHRHFSFMDDNLTLKKSHVLGVCNEIVKRGLNIQFETPNGVATGRLDKEIMDALTEAGLVRVSLAIESGSDYIREKVMHKRLTRNKIEEIVALTKEYPQLYTRAFFLMGMPEDTRETLEETYRMIENINVNKPIVTTVVPFPRTQLFEQCHRDNLFVDNLDLGTLWKQDLFFYTGNKRFFIKPYGMTLEELSEYRQKFDKLVERTTHD